MFLERLGKFCIAQMRPAFFYSLLAGPFLLVFSYLLMENEALSHLEDQFKSSSKKAKIAIERKAKKEKFLKRYSASDPYFLDTHIESLSFLQKEKDQINALVQHPALKFRQQLLDRLSFLSGPDNKLSFTEENIHISSQIKETDEKQRRSVQVDGSDLQKLLSLIEDLPIGSHLPQSKSPQLIIKDFKLQRKQNPLYSEVFEIEMELLKREWIKS
jgi:hypothetical protein